MGFKPRTPPGPEHPPAPRPRVPARAPRAGVATVESYVDRLEEPHREVVDRLRRLVRSVAPEAVEGIKWGMIHYAYRGNFLYVEAARDHVKLGFFDGAALEDPHRLLEGGGVRLRHLKLRRPVEAERDSVRDLLVRAYRR